MVGGLRGLGGLIWGGRRMMMMCMEKGFCASAL